MEYLLLGLSFVTAIISASNDYKNKNLFVVFWAFNILYFYLPITALISFQLTDYDAELMQDMLFFSVFFNLTYFLFSYFFDQYKLSHHNNWVLVVPDGFSKLFSGTIFCFFTLNIFWSMLKSYPNILAPNYDGSYALYVYLSPIFGGVLVLFWKSNTKIFFQASAVFIIFSLLMFKSRGLLICFATFLILELLPEKASWGWLRKVIVWILIGILSVVILKALRWSIGDNLSFAKFFNAFAVIVSDLFINGDFALYRYALKGIDMCANGYWACGEFLIMDKLITSKIFGYEVLTTPYHIASSLLGLGFQKEWTRHALVYGEFYFDGLWWGLIYSCFLAFLRFICKLIQSWRYGFLCFGGFLYFFLFLARGSIYNALVPLIFNLILVFLFFGAYRIGSMASSKW